jgi:RecJ-like exonuclease
MSAECDFCKGTGNEAVGLVCIRCDGTGWIIDDGDCDNEREDENDTEY